MTIVEFMENELTKYTITLSILAFLFGAIIKFWLDKETRSFQNKLEGKLEEYQHKLEVERIKLQISYGGIFEKQANALLGLHQSLIDLQHEADAAVNLGPEENAPKASFRRIWSQLRYEYSTNRALLPEDIDKSVKDFLEKIFKAVLAFQSVEQRILRMPSDGELDQLTEKQDKAFGVIMVEIPAIEQKIVESMRVRLGISTNL